MAQLCVHGAGHYAPDGTPITLGEWAVRFEGGPERFLARTRLPGRRLVSTIWLGLDLMCGHTERPIIFESSVFERPKAGGSHLGMVLDQLSYATRAEALAGHHELVRVWRGRAPGLEGQAPKEPKKYS